MFTFDIGLTILLLSMDMSRKWKRQPITPCEILVDAADLQARGLASRRTIYRWVSSGKMPVPSLINGRFVWRLKEIDSWVESRRIVVP